jgi:uncharacterized phage-associated protein
MPTVIDVANYFLSKVDRQSGETMIHLKLQKLIYYAQAWNMVFRNKPIFISDIQAWKRGPVAVEAWNIFPHSCYAVIHPPKQFIDFSKTFDSSELKILADVWDIYGSLSPEELMDLTHSEYPWTRARKGLPDNARSNETILLSDMKDYYESFVDLGNGDVPVGISKKAILEDKDSKPGNVITLTDKYGCKEWVRTDSIREHFEAKGEDRPFVKVEVKRPYKSYL